MMKNLFQCIRIIDPTTTSLKALMMFSSEVLNGEVEGKYDPVTAKVPQHMANQWKG